MPCASDHIAIVSRAKGQSCMAKCAYNSGVKRWSEYERCWKLPHSNPDRVRLIEVMLPPNAPREYADPEKLWNAVDAAEKAPNAQTARTMVLALPRELTFEQNVDLLHEYCQSQFVDKGMICNFFYHDEGDGNPHAHIMLTMRPMDEQGRFVMRKSTNVYELDENGNRKRRANGSYIRQKIFTVDWDDHKYGEIWRHEWEVVQNVHLEKAGRPERVDMRSYKRQGIDRLPQRHLGPAASMEEKGIQTNLGNRNRSIFGANEWIKALQKAVADACSWLEEIKSIISHTNVIEHPDDHALSDVLIAWSELRKAGRATWSERAQDKGSLNDHKEMMKAIAFMETRDIRTVGQLSHAIAKTSAELKGLKSDCGKCDR